MLSDPKRFAGLLILVGNNFSVDIDVSACPRDLKSSEVIELLEDITNNLRRDQVTYVE